MKTFIVKYYEAKINGRGEMYNEVVEQKIEAKSFTIKHGMAIFSDLGFNSPKYKAVFRDFVSVVEE